MSVGPEGLTNLSLQKQVEMLHELVPTTTVTAALFNPTFPGSESQSRDLQAAAHKLGLQLHVLHASTERDFDPTFATMIQLRAGMLVIGADPYFFGHRDQIAALAIRHRMPAIFFLREFATVGGLMSYGPIVTERYRQESTKFELVINLKTARALNLEKSRDLLLIADDALIDIRWDAGDPASFRQYAGELAALSRPMSSWPRAVQPWWRLKEISSTIPIVFVAACSKKQVNPLPARQGLLPRLHIGFAILLVLVIGALALASSSTAEQNQPKDDVGRFRAKCSAAPMRWGTKSDEASTCKRYAPAAQREKMSKYRAWFHERRRPPRA